MSLAKLFGRALSNYTLVTLHDVQISLSSIPLPIPQSTSFTLTSTLTVPFSNRIPSHNSFHDPGEWQNASLPRKFSLIPSTGIVICDPNIIEPGSGESREATWRAICSCFASSNKWKNAPMKMAETRPCSGVREVRDLSSRGAVNGGV